MSRAAADKFQSGTFLAWVNFQLGQAKKAPVKNLTSDLSTGVKLLELMGTITGKGLPKYAESPKNQAQKLDNVGKALKMASDYGVKLTIGAEDIVNPKEGLILGFLWTLVQKFVVDKALDDKTDKKKTPQQRLLDSLNNYLKPYPAVYPMKNFSSDWSNGLGFALLVHRFRPELVPMAELIPRKDTPDGLAKNVAFALDLAEKEFGVPKLLDPVSFVASKDNLDQTSIMTYVAVVLVAVRGQSYVDINEDDLKTSGGDVYSALTIASLKKKVEELEERLKSCGTHEETISGLKAQLKFQKEEMNGALAKAMEKMAALAKTQKELQQQVSTFKEQNGLVTAQVRKLQAKLKHAEEDAAERKASKVPAPEGELTLVFTDIQGSTQLWELFPEQMGDAIKEHNRKARELLEAVSGYEVKTEGDAFMCAFADPLAAVKFMLLLQEALPDLPYGKDMMGNPNASEVSKKDTLLYRGFRVRSGAHTGSPSCEPDPTTGRMDYFGPMVNRSARVGGVAHGGQVLVSGSTWKKIEGSLDKLQGPATKDLGAYRLKGLESDEQLVQVLPKRFALREFPPINPASSAKVNKLMDELGALKNENEKLNSAMAEMEAKLAEAAAAAKALEDQLRNLSRNASGGNSPSGALGGAYNELEVLLSVQRKLEEDLLNSRTRTQALAAQVDAAARGVEEELNRQVEETRREGQLEIGNLKSQVDQLRSQINSGGGAISNEEVTRLQADIKGVDRSVAHVLGRVETARHAAGGLLRKYDSLLNRLAYQSANAKDNSAAGAAEPPSGSNVAMVLCDIERASSLWETVPQVMAATVSLANKTVRTAVDKHGAYVNDVIGETWALLFTNSELATKFALEIQEAFMGVTWPAGLEALPQAATLNDPKGSVLLRGPRLRVAIHTGEPITPSAGKGRRHFTGTGLSTASRMLVGSAGGQIVITAPVQAAIKSQLAGMKAVSKSIGKHNVSFPVGAKEPPAAVEVFSVVPNSVAGRTFLPFRPSPNERTLNVVEESAANLKTRLSDISSSLKDYEKDVRGNMAPALAKLQSEVANIKRDTTSVDKKALTSLYKSMDELTRLHAAVQKDLQRSLGSTDSVANSISSLNKELTSKLAAIKKETGKDRIMVRQIQSLGKEVMSLRAALEAFNSAPSIASTNFDGPVKMSADGKPAAPAPALGGAVAHYNALLDDLRRALHVSEETMCKWYSAVDVEARKHPAPPSGVNEPGADAKRALELSRKNLFLCILKTISVTELFLEGTELLYNEDEVYALFKSQDRSGALVDVWIRDTVASHPSDRYAAVGITADRRPSLPATPLGGGSTPIRRSSSRKGSRSSSRKGSTSRKK